MVPAVALLILLFAIPAYGRDYIVGAPGNTWDTGVNYNTWVAGKTFFVGDRLVFTYSSTQHTVDQVSLADYTSCSSSSPIKSNNDGNTTIALSTTGTFYYICGTAGHCTGGMKVAVPVSAATTTASPPPPSSTTPGTPSTGTPTTPPSTTSSPPPPPSSPSSASHRMTNILMLGASILFVVVFAL